MMRRKRTDLWKDNDNNEIEPQIKEIITEPAGITNIDWLKEVSVKCSAFKAEERPTFAELTPELQQRFEQFANRFRKLNRGDSYEEYQDNPAVQTSNQLD